VNSADLASIAPKDRSVSIAPAKPVLRICSVCGCQDKLAIIEGDLDARGQKRIEHFVTIELRYLKDQAECTPAKKAKGWRARIHQGRHAMERFICRVCLIATREMSEEFGRKRSKELGVQNHDPYYLAVCGE
jgi:hypothetical protein